MWLHSDQGDQSDSWQLTGHSTTQEAFICHFLSRPNWKTRRHSVGANKEAACAGLENLYTPTSLQKLRSTDLPSLRTQSNMRVLIPFPHTALSLSWQVLQSAGTQLVQAYASDMCSGLGLTVQLGTSDVVGVVETVAVKCAGFCLLCWGADLVCPRLAQRVSTSSTSAGHVTWLRRKRGG